MADRKQDPAFDLLHFATLPLCSRLDRMIAIETQGLSKTFSEQQGWRRWLGGNRITAVSDVTLTVSTGELFGLLGPNGAGKTTLVKMLCTLIRPGAGEARVAGHSLAEAGAIRARVGLVVSDERSFYWRLSGRRNLAFFAAMHGLHGAAAGRRIGRLLAEVELEEAAERPFRTYSSGMRQRLAIARALLHRPRILFLDEPSRSLDPTATGRLHALIRRLQREWELTVFLITHDLAEAEKLCDRVALMHRGRIRTIGSPAALRERLRPQRLYRLRVVGMETAEVETAVLAPLRARVSALAYAGGELSFRAGENEETVTAVIDHLRRHQITIQTITATPPSLEEVFAHYTGQGFRSGAEQDG